MKFKNHSIYVKQTNIPIIPDFQISKLASLSETEVKISNFRRRFGVPCWMEEMCYWWRPVDLGSLSVTRWPSTSSVRTVPRKSSSFVFRLTLSSWRRPSLLEYLQHMSPRARMFQKNTLTIFKLVQHPEHYAGGGQVE